MRQTLGAPFGVSNSDLTTPAPSAALRWAAVETTAIADITDMSSVLQSLSVYERVFSVFLEHFCLADSGYSYLCVICHIWISL